MTTTEISHSLADIATGGIALPAVIEYELEDLGLIATDHGPYAKLTAEGHRVLEQAEACSKFGANCAVLRTTTTASVLRAGTCGRRLDPPKKPCPCRCHKSDS